jgi:hypothetical protein
MTGWERKDERSVWRMPVRGVTAADSVDERRTEGGKERGRSPLSSQPYSYLPVISISHHHYNNPQTPLHAFLHLPNKF